MEGRFPRVIFVRGCVAEFERFLYAFQSRFHSKYCAVSKFGANYTRYTLVVCATGILTRSAIASTSVVHFLRGEFRRKSPTRSPDPAPARPFEHFSRPSEPQASASLFELRTRYHTTHVSR